MHIRPIAGTTIAALIVSSIAFLAQDVRVAAQTATATPTPTATAVSPAACPTGATLVVSAPTPGAPTTVSVVVTPTSLNIKAASAADPTSFHLHYFIDTTASAAGTVIPAGDPKIIHSGTLTQDLGALTAGSHTVTVVLGQFTHTACETRSSVTFTVAANAAPGTIISGSVPTSGGFGLFVFGGGTIAQLVTATGCPAASMAVWATAGGSFIVYVPGTTISVVNAEFLATFPGGNIPANTPFVGKCV